MFGGECDVQVGDEPLTVHGAVKIPAGGSGRHWDERAEESEGLRISDCSAVIDDGLEGGLDGGVTVSPRVKGERCVHDCFAELIDGLAVHQGAHMWTACRAWQEKPPSHGLDEFWAGYEGHCCGEGGQPCLRNTVLLVETFHRMGTLVGCLSRPRRTH